MVVNLLKIIVFVIAGLAALGMIVVARQVFVIGQSVKRGQYHQRPYERELPKPDWQFLFLGDSTAVGTGARTPQGSTAGYFAKDFPNAQIVNRGQNGKRIHELLTDLEGGPPGLYDLIVVQIGANDIVHFTSYREIERDLNDLLKRIKWLGPHVVILHSGNMGTAPILRWPFTWIMTQRSRDVRSIYIRQAQRHKVVYVDLFLERKDDLFLTDIPKYFSPDGFHPTEEGYRFWYQRIRQSLNEANIRLEH